MFDLTEGQQEAKDNILKLYKESRRSRETIFVTLIGPAGSGKSTLVADVIKSLPRTDTIGLTATTHKATKVVKKMAFNQKIDFVDVRTIHSALRLSMKRSYGEEILYREDFVNERLYDILLIDECSMIGYSDEERAKIAKDLLNYILETKTKMVLFIGDDAQIGPVGGSDEVSLTFTEVDNICRLTEIMRTAEGNPIISTAHEFRLMQETPYIGFPQITTQLDEAGHGTEVLGQNNFLKQACDRFKSQAFIDDPDHVRIVCYTNDCVDIINAAMRRAIYGNGCADYIVGEIIVAQSGGPGEDGYNNAEEFKVTAVHEYTDDEFDVDAIQLEIQSLEDYRYHTVLVVSNEYLKTYQGRLNGLADRANAAGKKGGKHYWKEFWKLNDKFQNFKYVYAMTAHKSQGSTFDYTYLWTPDFIRFGATPAILRLMYTGITRSRYRTVFGRP